MKLLKVQTKHRKLTKTNMVKRFSRRRYRSRKESRKRCNNVHRTSKVKCKEEIPDWTCNSCCHKNIKKKFCHICSEKKPEYTN